MKQHIIFTYKPNLVNLSQILAMANYTETEHDFIKEGFSEFNAKDSIFVEYSEAEKSYKPYNWIKDRDSQNVGALVYYKIDSPSYRFIMNNGHVSKKIDKYRTEIILVAEIDNMYLQKALNDKSLQDIFNSDMLEMFINSKKAIEALD